MKVSILVPVYGVEKYIERCARSLFEQTYEDLEYIFVDDCSPDNSIEILKNTLENYPKRKEQVKIIHHDKNQGLSGARNTALSHATGDYVLFVDSDDEITHSCIDDMVESLKEKEVDFVLADWAFVGFSNATSALRLEQGIYMGDEIFDTFCSSKWYVMAQNKLVKREFILKNNLFFFHGIVHEDELWTFQLASTAKSMGVIKNKTYKYYNNSGSIMNATAAIREVNSCLTIIREIHRVMTNKNLDVFKCQHRLDYLENRAKVNMKKMGFSNYKIYRKLRSADISTFKEKVKWCFKDNSFRPFQLYRIMPIPLGYAYQKIFTYIRNKL